MNKTKFSSYTVKHTRAFFNLGFISICLISILVSCQQKRRINRQEVSRLYELQSKPNPESTQKPAPFVFYNFSLEKITSSNELQINFYYFQSLRKDDTSSASLNQFTLHFLISKNGILHNANNYSHQSWYCLNPIGESDPIKCAFLEGELKLSDQSLIYLYFKFHLAQMTSENYALMYSIPHLNLPVELRYNFLSPDSKKGL